MKGIFLSFSFYAVIVGWHGKGRLLRVYEHGRYIHAAFGTGRC